MKLTTASILLAVSSALAVPTNIKRDSYIQISDLWAKAGPSTYGDLPKSNARCNNGEYYIKFPNGAPDFNWFTLELRRVNGSIPEDGHVLLSSNANGAAPGTMWICLNAPEPGIEISCSYDGVLQMDVS
ncbi:hypothetical protein IFM5058_04974 [Aspergillus udagawae]|nr:hypothetical protein IFM5058_04974 [Aspergillus udagawae]